MLYKIIHSELKQTPMPPPQEVCFRYDKDNLHKEPGKFEMRERGTRLRGEGNVSNRTVHTPTLSDNLCGRNRRGKHMCHRNMN